MNNDQEDLSLSWIKSEWNSKGQEIFMKSRNYFIVTCRENKNARKHFKISNEWMELVDGDHKIAFQKVLRKSTELESTWTYWTYIFNFGFFQVKVENAEILSEILESLFQFCLYFNRFDDEMLSLNVVSIIHVGPIYTSYVCIVSTLSANYFAAYARIIFYITI